MTSPAGIKFDDFIESASNASTPTPPSLTNESSPESVLQNDEVGMSDFSSAPYYAHGAGASGIDDGSLRQDDIKLFDDERLEPAWASETNSDTFSKMDAPSDIDAMSPMFPSDTATGIQLHEQLFDTLIEPENCAPPSAFEAPRPSPPAAKPETPDIALSAAPVVRPSRDSLPNDLELLIHGIPTTGAKSRVETQIRMQLELVRRQSDHSYERIGSFSHIKVPPLSGTKRKSRKYQPPNVSPESILQLEATVVNSTPPHARVFVCDNCRERERKRAHRRKGRRVNHSVQATPEEMRALGIDPNSPNAAELASNVMEEEERKHAVLFNCGDYLSFSDGTAVLSTRITCYCRHHQEKVGFCIVFVLRTSQGEFVATQTTPPIMIMDDHKSSAGAAQAKRERTHLVNGSQPQEETNSRMRPYDDSGRQRRMSTSYTMPPMFMPQDASMVQTLAQEPMPAPIQLNQFFHGMDTPIAADPNAPAPIITKLIPSDGPVTGGIEITVLGENFTDGVTCFFGDTPSSLTRVWADTTLVCLLPPSMHAGSVPVTIRPQDMAPMAARNTAVQLFTYVDTTDRALMELALQVVGLQMTGQMSSARDIAMRIVGTQSGNNGQTMQPQSMQHSLLSLVSLLDLNMGHPSALGSYNQQGHTLLHLAAACGFDVLAEDLAARGCPLDAQDRNGFTALHFGALRGHPDVVQSLLRNGASPLVAASNGDLALDAARRSGDVDIKSMLDTATAGDDSELESDGESDTVSAASDASITFAELIAAQEKHGESAQPPQRSTWDPLGLLSPWIQSPNKRQSAARSDDSSDEEGTWGGRFLNRLSNSKARGQPFMNIASPPQLMSPPPTYDEATLDNECSTSKHIDGEKLFAPGSTKAVALAERAGHAHKSSAISEDAFIQVNDAAKRDPIVRVRPSVRDDHMLLWFWIPALVFVIGVSLYISISPARIGETASMRI